MLSPDSPVGFRRWGALLLSGSVLGSMLLLAGCSSGPPRGYPPPPRGPLYGAPTNGGPSGSGTPPPIALTPGGDAPGPYQPISSPTFGNGPGSPNAPVPNPTNPSGPPTTGGLTLTPLSSMSVPGYRMRAFGPTTYPTSPLYGNGAVGQIYASPTAVMPYGSSPTPAMQFADAGRSVDGRSAPLLNVSGRSISTHMKSALHPGSRADRSHRARSGRVGQPPKKAALAAGFNPTPNMNLKYRGGRTIKDLKYINIFLGGNAAWKESDWKNINRALEGAMIDPKLNHVMMQYFDGKPISAEFRGSYMLAAVNPTRLTQPQVKDLVKQLYANKQFDGLPLDSTIVTFYLPRGAVLADPEAAQQTTNAPSNKLIPHEEESSSLEGLGGYHGSVHIGSDVVYYAACVFSERTPDGRTNGIPVFPDAWKNVCATAYHELQEARTDPDVDDAIATGQENYLGWTTDNGEEIGDYPIEEAGADLKSVIKEVPLSDGSGTVPIQLCYSNAAQGPEGPIDRPYSGQPLSQPARRGSGGGSNGGGGGNSSGGGGGSTTGGGTGRTNSGSLSDDDLNVLQDSFDSLPAPLRQAILDFIAKNRAR